MILGDSGESSLRARSAEGIESRRTASESISPKNCRNDSTRAFKSASSGSVLGQAHGAIENAQAGVELAPLAFGEDPAEEGPDIGLGTEQLAALAGPMDLVHDPPGKQLAKIHADVAAGDRRARSEGRRPSSRCP